MHRRRRPDSTSTPQLPSTPALIAASAVYHPSSLAAAAAGAALRHASTSPVPLEQRTGSIPTRRMLKRRDSYSSVPSDSDQRPQMQRTGSGSLTERSFRESVNRKVRESERPAAPTPRAAAGRRRWSPESSDADDSEGFGRSVSLKSNASTRSFPTTLRKQSLSKRTPKEKSMDSMFSRGLHRRSSDPDAPVGYRRKTLRKLPLASNGIARLSQGDYGGSAGSLSTSELESIAEDTANRELKRVSKIPEDPEDEDREDTFEFSRKRIGRTRTNVQNTNGKGKRPPDPRPPPNTLEPTNTPTRTSSHSHSHSPSRTTFSLSTLATTPPKHSPPPRSVSPSKSALKHQPSPFGHSTIPHSEAGSVRKVRVSFSEEDSIGSSSLVSGDTTSRKLVFGGLGNADEFEMAPVVLAPSPPTGNSSEGSDTENILRWPRRQAPLGKTKRPATPPENTTNLPELVLIIPTPKDEKREEDGALLFPGSFPSRSRGDRYDHDFSIDAVASGGALSTERDNSDSDSDSFSGGSIYSDAYEDLTAVPASPEPPRTPDSVPLSAVRPRSGSLLTTNLCTSPDTHTNDILPLFDSNRLPQPTPTQHQYSTSSSTVSFSDDASDAVSVSSFRRISPREKRTGMMSSLRGIPFTSSAPSKDLPQNPPHKPTGVRSSLRATSKFQSRFVDSDSDFDPRPQQQPFHADTNGTVSARERGFWRIFLLKRKLPVDHILDKETGSQPRTVIVKKSKLRPKLEGVWAGGAQGTRTVISSGLAKEVGADAVNMETGGTTKKKRFGTLRKMLRLRG